MECCTENRTQERLKQKTRVLTVGTSRLFKQSRRHPVLLKIELLLIPQGATSYSLLELMPCPPLLCGYEFRNMVQPMSRLAYIATSRMTGTLLWLLCGSETYKWQETISYFHHFTPPCDHDCQHVLTAVTTPSSTRAQAGPSLHTLYGDHRVLNWHVSWASCVWKCRQSLAPRSAWGTKVEAEIPHWIFCPQNLIASRPCTHPIFSHQYLRSSLLIMLQSVGLFSLRKYRSP
jgi:hypothetical protein